MEYIHAALLLHEAGKELNEKSLKEVLESAGVEADDARLKALMSALKDVDIEEAISTPVAAAAAPAAAAPAAEEAEEKKEEKEEEEEEASDEDAAAGLATLFG